MKGDEHIVHRVADKMLSEEKRSEIEDRSRAALRLALERSGSPHAQSLEKPETRRRIRKQTLTRHALRKYDIDQDVPFMVEDWRDFVPTRFSREKLLEKYPHALISELAPHNEFEKARIAYESIMHEQQLRGEKLSQNPHDALEWLQKFQAKSSCHGYDI